MDYIIISSVKPPRVCHILMDFLTYDNEESEKYKLLCRKRFEMEPNKSKAEGANPQIFRYEFHEPDEFGLIALRIYFLNL